MASSPGGAVEQLFLGPNALEAEIGMSSEIPSATTLLDLTVSNGAATVDLSGDFEESSGTLSETFRLAQVVFTLTQFDDIDTVLFQIDGENKTEVGSHGIDVSGGVDRDDFTDVRALITVEGPYPGSELDDSFHLTGESNTFEAGIEWVVTDSEGLIIAEGFGMSAGGNGVWGAFDLAIDLPEQASGSGAVIVFDTSAKDGSQENIVEYPVRFSGNSG